MDTVESNCRSEGGTPVGDDAASETCLLQDSGTPAVTMTFNAGAQDIGGLSVIPTVAPFAGVDPENPIIAVNNETPFSAELPIWSTTGDLIEITMRTKDNSYPSSNEDDFWGFSATGIQYPNADANSEIGLPFDEDLGNYTNFYFWFEDANGPITEGYDIFLDVGIGVGGHPVDEREVIYIFYSEGQVDDFSDTLAGGSLDFHSHGSILNEVPQIGNLLVLADSTGVEDGLAITGFGIGFLVQPPELGSAELPGDFDFNGELEAADIDLLSKQVGQTDLMFDLNGDAAVDEDDRVFWIETLAETFAGDADLNGSVEFGDFLALSAGFGSIGGWAVGDFDGSGDVAFADFLLLSSNFGSSRAADTTQSVPEPSAVGLCMFGLLATGCVRRRRKVA